MRAAEQQPRPFSDDEIRKLFAPVAKESHVAIAVSGGSDSVALMHLVHCWKFGRHPGESRNPMHASLSHRVSPSATRSVGRVDAEGGRVGSFRARVADKYAREGEAVEIASFHQQPASGDTPPVARSARHPPHASRGGGRENRPGEVSESDSASRLDDGGAASVPKLTILTVDHRLRPESTEEARSVGGWARDLGIDHVVLPWQGTKPVTGLAAAAREARYRLMGEWCRANGAAFLLVAHTLDDQAETVMMRLARGAGVEGLGAMTVLTSHHGLTIFRPLLAIAHHRLRDHLRTIGQDWCEDPTNQDERFERARLRKALEGLNAAGVGAEAISQTAARSRRAWDAILTITRRFLRNSLSHHAEGFGEVALASLLSEPEEIRIRALWLLVRRYGDGGFLELSQAESLSRWLDTETGAARTLGGCRIVRRPLGLLFGREPGRISPEPVPVPPSGILRWDNRFDISAGEDQADIAILPAGRAGKVVRRPDLPAFVQAGLPAVMLGGELAAIPSLGLTTEAAPPGFKVSATFGSASWP